MLFQNSSHMCRSFSFSLCVCMLSHVRFNRVSIVGEELFIRYTFDVNRNPIALYLLATGLCFAFVAVVFRSQEFLFCSSIARCLALYLYVPNPQHTLTAYHGTIAFFLYFFFFFHFYMCFVATFSHFSTVYDFRNPTKQEKRANKPEIFLSTTWKNHLDRHSRHTYAHPPICCWKTEPG